MNVRRAVSLGFILGWFLVGCGHIPTPGSIATLETPAKTQPPTIMPGTALTPTPAPTKAWTYTPLPTYTEYPTATPYPTYTSAPTYTALPATPTSTRTPTPEWTTNISDGEQVAHVTTLIVEYSGHLEGDLWVFVKPRDSDYYYPQSQDACSGKRASRVNEKWEIRLFIGDLSDVEKDVGDSFDIVLAIAKTSLDSQFIGGRLIKWCRENSYPGFEGLPSRVTEVHRIKEVELSMERWGKAPLVSNDRFGGQVNISSIASNQLVTETATISGDYQSITGHIWVLVYPVHGLWYPQSQSACAGDHTYQEDGQWKVSARFGEDLEKTFDVVVVLANDDANEFFEQTQETWCSAGHSFGLLTVELPQGIEEKDRVRVYREGAER